MNLLFLLVQVSLLDTGSHLDDDRQVILNYGNKLKLFTAGPRVGYSLLQMTFFTRFLEGLVEELAS